MALVAALAMTSQTRAQTPHVGSESTVPGSTVASSTVAEVLVVLASEAAGTIDPALAKVPALRKPPFSSYGSMRVLSRPQIRLEGGKPVTVNLPNERTLRLELQERMADGRFKVSVSINKPQQKDYLPLLQVLASPGEPFFVAGQSYQGGTLVIGVQVGASADDLQ